MAALDSKVRVIQNKTLTLDEKAKNGRGYRRQTLWLAGLVALIALVLAIGPGLVRSNKLPLPVLNNLENPVRLEGFYPTEANSTATFRWTGPAAKIYLPEATTPQTVSLDVAAAYPEGSPRPRLHLRYNGQEIGNWTIGNEWTRLEAKFPANFTFTTQPLEIEIENPLAPRKADSRTLGMAVRAVDLEVSRIAPLDIIIENVVLGVALLLVGRWLGFGVRRALFASLGPVLVLSLYWQLERFYASVLVGVITLLIGLATFVALYPRAFFPTGSFSKTSGYWFNGGFLDGGLSSRVRLYAKLLVWLPPVLIVGFVFLEYGRAFDYGFFWDDYHIARPWTASEIANAFAGTWDSLGLEPAYFRPLTVLSFGVDWALWSFEPGGYHLTNLWLHTATALLLYTLMRRLRLNWSVALVGALFFVILPPNVATADWISQRSDSLAAIFMLTGLLAFEIYQGSSKIRWLVGANLALILALCSKEIAVVLPVLFLILPQRTQTKVQEKGPGFTPAPTKDYHPFRVSGAIKNWKKTALSFGPSFLILALYLGWRSRVLPSGLADTPNSLSLENLWNGYSSAVYQSFYGLDNWLSEKAAPWFTLTLLALAGLLWLFGYKAKVWRVFGFGLGWIVVTCAPLAFLGASYSVTARVLYLPEVGYAIGAAALLGLLLQFAEYTRSGWRFWPVVILVAFLVIAPYSPLHNANQRAQKDYAPTSFNTLRWDEWIYNNPAWKAKIPERNFRTIEEKLKKAGKL